MKKNNTLQFVKGICLLPQASLNPNKTLIQNPKEENQETKKRDGAHSGNGRKAGIRSIEEEARRSERCSSEPAPTHPRSCQFQSSGIIFSIFYPVKEPPFA